MNTLLIGFIIGILTNYIIKLFVYIRGNIDTNKDELIARSERSFIGKELEELFNNRISDEDFINDVVNYIEKLNK